MQTSKPRPQKISRALSRAISIKRSGGVTLIELIVFIVVISIALGALLSVYNQSIINSVNPITQVRALECAQTKLDEILARKFDESTPSGGIPACGSFGTGGCSGISADSSMDDVGDYHSANGSAVAGCTFDITVTASGFGGIDDTQSRLVTVTATATGGDSVTLSSYRTNF